MLALLFARLAFAQPAPTQAPVAPPEAAPVVAPAPAEALPVAAPVADAAPATTIVPAAPSEAEIAATHEALRALAATLQDAMNKGDVDTIAANVDPNVVFTTMNSDVVRGRDGVKAYFAKMMTGPDAVVKHIDAKFDVDELTWLVAPDVGIAWGGSTGHYDLTDGTSFDVKARWTATVLRRDGKWVVGAFHYSSSMFDNPVIDAINAFTVRAGVGIGAVVLLAGIGVGWMLGRRGSRP
jgi:uncharacterized protein (TIGR02246 family)